MHILHSGQNLFTFIFDRFGIKHRNKAIARWETLVLHFHKQKRAAATFIYSEFDESSNITVSTINEKVKKLLLRILTILLENNVFMRNFTFPFD